MRIRPCAGERARAFFERVAYMARLVRRAFRREPVPAYDEALYVGSTREDAIARHRADLERERALSEYGQAPDVWPKPERRRQGAR